jgi:hypothetical protein
MATSMRIDASDLQKFSRSMRKASKGMGAKLRKAEKAAAEVVADRAREIVAEHSEKAAAHVKVFTSGALFGVQTGSPEEPLGVFLEVGNASSDAEILRSQRAGGFRHPVFPTGDRSTWHWSNTPEKLWPHLGPAAREKTDECLDKLLDGVNEVLKDVNLKLE